MLQPPRLPSRLKAAYPSIKCIWLASLAFTVLFHRLGGCKSKTSRVPVGVARDEAEQSDLTTLRHLMLEDQRNSMEYNKTCDFVDLRYNKVRRSIVRRMKHLMVDK